MVKELCYHRIQTVLQHLLLLTASLAGAQSRQCVCTCVTYEHVLDIHRYLQVWSHNQMDILNVK